MHHGLLLAGGVRHELLLARLGLYTTRLGLYAMNCCWLGWGCTPRGLYARTCCWLGSVLLLEVGVVRHDLLLARLGMYTNRQRLYAATCCL